MSGHAAHLLYDCVRCPKWAPKNATGINDANEKVCTQHLLDTMPEFAPVGVSA